MLGIKTRDRPAIGLMISHIDGSYQRLFWRGLHAFCQQHDCDLILYASRYWRGMSSERVAQESVYRLADKSRIDGICIDASAFESEQECSTFLGSMPGLQGIPVLLISMRSTIQNLPSICPDDQDGIRQAVGHLVQHHHCSRLAFVGGPLGFHVAQERWVAFIESCRALGLHIPPEAMVRGGFDTPSGRSATFTLLDQLDRLPEAIVYANDNMAFGGLAALQERGIAVPDQIKVVGFDDFELSAFATPPLASIRQPIYDEGWQAGDSLLQSIEGLPIPQEQTSAVNYIPRASCGCSSNDSDSQRLEYERGVKSLMGYQDAISCIKRITDQMGTILSLPKLAQEFARLMPMVRRGGAYIALFDNTCPTIWEPSSHSHLISAVDAQGEILVDPYKPRRFLSSQLIPAYLLPHDQRRTLVVQGLFIEPRNFGYLVHEYQEEDPSILEAMRYQVSAALYNIALSEEEQLQRKELQIALDRAEESERRYRELALFLPTIIMETDPAGRITFLNNTGKETFDLSEQELQEQPLLEEFIASDHMPQASGPPSTAKSYQQMHIRTRQGRTATLLVKTASDPQNPNHVRWNGIDFMPILSSLAFPKADLFNESKLSPREQEILTLELTGLIGKEIADHLSLSLSTVKAHIGSIYRKIGVNSRDQLFQRVREKLVDSYGFDSLIFSLMAQLMRE